MEKETFQIRFALKLFVLIILTLIPGYSAYSQTNKSACNCAKSEWTKGTKADTVYHLANGKNIALCGYFEPGSNKREFSEFTLTVCGQNKIIDFWSAVLTCRLLVKKDTLLVHVIKDFPYGMNLKFQPTIWTTEKIYFSGQKTLRKMVLNRQIPKYNPAEISNVLTTYEMAKPGLDDNKLILVNELFIASISGSKKARQYFQEFKTKFGLLDGVYGEEYIDLTSMLALWDKNK